MPTLGRSRARDTRGCWSPVYGDPASSRASSRFHRLEQTCPRRLLLHFGEAGVGAPSDGMHETRSCSPCLPSSGESGGQEGSSAQHVGVREPAPPVLLRSRPQVASKGPAPILRRRSPRPGAVRVQVIPSRPPLVPRGCDSSDQHGFLGLILWAGRRPGLHQVTPPATAAIRPAVAHRPPAILEASLTGSVHA